MGRGLIKATGYGMAAAFILIITSALIVSTLLKLTDLQESSVSQIPAAASFAGLFIGGIIAGAKYKQRGLMIGALTGLIYCLFILMIGFLGYEAGFDWKQGLFYVCNIAVAAIGGALGVNLFSHKKTKKR